LEVLLVTGSGPEKKAHFATALIKIIQNFNKNFKICLKFKPLQIVIQSVCQALQ
jgi:hypothetical protein